MDGIIFDIQRNSLNDGPGIRTTIFLKGCSLNCIWCHNEESKDLRPMLRFYADKCENCMKCVEVCKVAAHINLGGKHKVLFENCIQNWDCIEVCPSAALARTGRYMSEDDLIKLVMKDKDYYDNSGGGLTISGGEPMLQFSFTHNLLKAAKSRKIHTCLDTSGNAAWEKYKELIPLTDIFLFDYKETDSIKHKEYTGVNKDRIIKNLYALNESGARIILRCPLIPDLNDRQDHFKAIAELSTTLKNIIEVHILPYHTMGAGKAEQHGIQKDRKLFAVPSELQKQEWQSTLDKFGAKNISIF